MVVFELVWSYMFWLVYVWFCTGLCFIVLFGLLQSYMVRYGHVWSYMVFLSFAVMSPYGPVWFLFVFYDRVWSRMFMYGVVWSCIFLFCPVRSGMVMFALVCQVFGLVQSCLVMYCLFALACIILYEAA